MAARDGSMKASSVALIALAVMLMCGCSSTVFLVLTGIIAEPETVIEQIVRGLGGG